MEMWLSEREAVEMNVGRRRNSRRRLVGTILQIRGRKNRREGLEYQEGKIKKGDPEQRPLQEYCKQCQQRYPTRNITSRIPTNKKHSQLLAEIVQAVLLVNLSFVLLTRQLILVATSAVQNLSIVLNNHLADTMDSSRKNEAQYLTLKEISNTASASSPSGPTPSPTPAREASSSTPILPPHQPM